LPSPGRDPSGLAPGTDRHFGERLNPPSQSGMFALAVAPQRPSTMTSQGTAHGRFQRAIRDRHLRRATMAARELGTVSLADALALTLLTAETGDDRWPRAAAR
jgi:hypothetical protein